MTREQILRDALTMARHNLNCYTVGYDWDKAKPGHEDDAQRERETTATLEAWLAELADSPRLLPGETLEVFCADEWKAKTHAAAEQYIKNVKIASADEDLYYYGKPPKWKGDAVKEPPQNAKLCKLCALRNQ
jgi:hypothetical protein